MKLTGIEKALSNGCTVHGFRSGGGLRVIRIEKKNKLLGYGEHPNVEDALSHANEDFLAGGRPYNKVYGGTKPHYLTGSSTSTSPLDHWLLQGYTFDAWKNGKGVAFRLAGQTQVELPKEILDEVLRSGKPAMWEHRGYTYRITKSSLPNKEPCTASEVVKSPDGKKNGSNPWMYHITKTGHGKNFFKAMENAFKARKAEAE